MDVRGRIGKQDFVAKAPCTLIFVSDSAALSRKFKGESAWNKENRFTGWTDVPLSEKGIEEARAAGQLLKREGYAFDLAFTSVLKRAIKTLWLVLEEMDRMWIPVRHSWKLNERHYGSLQGLNKAETAAKYACVLSLKMISGNNKIIIPRLFRSDVKTVSLIIDICFNT